MHIDQQEKTTVHSGSTVSTAYDLRILAPTIASALLIL